MKKTIAETLSGVLFPRVCPLCKEILTPKETADGNPYICDCCYGELHFTSESREKVENSTLSGSKKKFILHQKERQYFDEAIALLVHDEAAKKILYDLKYSNKRDNADLIGKEVALRFYEKIFSWGADAFIPVPLHKRRKLERDFNQSELIAKKLSANLEDLFGVEIKTDDKVLERTSKTAPQKDLGVEERYKNVKGKFGLSKALREGGGVPYERVILIDGSVTKMIRFLGGCLRVKVMGCKPFFYFRKQGCA